MLARVVGAAKTTATESITSGLRRKKEWWPLCTTRTPAGPAAYHRAWAGSASDLPPPSQAKEKCPNVIQGEDVAVDVAWLGSGRAENDPLVRGLKYSHRPRSSFPPYLRLQSRQASDPQDLARSGAGERRLVVMVMRVVLVHAGRGRERLRRGLAAEPVRSES